MAISAPSMTFESRSSGISVSCLRMWAKGTLQDASLTPCSSGKGAESFWTPQRYHRSVINGVMAPNHLGQVHGETEYIQQETEGPVNTWISVMSGDMRGILNSGKPFPVEAHCGVFIPLILTERRYTASRDYRCLRGQGKEVGEKPEFTEFNSGNHQVVPELLRLFLLSGRSGFSRVISMIEK